MPLFRSKKDIAFMTRINREIVDRVIGEEITYYPVSLRYTETNFYGESRKKIVDPPVNVFALIEWREQDVSTDKYGQDRIYLTDVYIVNDHLKDIQLAPKEGDFFDYGGVKFEITEVNEPKLIFGKENQELATHLVGRSVRKNTFEISVSGVVQQPKRTRPDDDGDLVVGFADALFPYSGSST